MMEPTPVYICTGFLDSGKTLLVKDTLMEQEWIEPGLTLLILCEEGEEEYSKEYLEENDMVLLKIDKFEQLNAAFFTNCEKNYHPAQVVIEYNDGEKTFTNARMVGGKVDTSKRAHKKAKSSGATSTEQSMQR